MQRTQISLTEEDRRLLDVAAAQTGCSLSALIRAAVQLAYGEAGDVEGDLAALESAFGGWSRDGDDGAVFVDKLRSGRRLRDRA